MRWDDLDSSSKWAVAFVVALITTGLLAAALWLKLQEQWPLLVFLLALFGVALFLGGISAWQRFTAPKPTSLSAFKRATMFNLSLFARRAGSSVWSIARDVCLVLLLLSLAAFVVHSIAIGGDAIRGGVKEGRYFVCLHTATTEVSVEQWQLNRCLGWTVFALLPLTIVVTVVSVYKEQHDRFHYLDLDERR